MKKTLFFLFFLSYLSLTSLAADLELDHIEYSWDSACQYYKVTTELDTTAREPSIFDLKVNYGQVTASYWEIKTYVEKQVTTPVYKQVCINVTNNLSGYITKCSTEIDTSKEAITTTIKTTAYTPDFSKETITTKEPTIIRHCIKFTRQYIKGRGYVIEADMIPELDSKVYTEYAWYNSSFVKRYDIINESVGIPTRINGTRGCNNTYVFGNSRVNANLTFYFNSCSDYSVVENETTTAFYETERGGLNNSIYKIYDQTSSSFLTNNSYIAMLHFGMNETNKVFNSRTENDDGLCSRANCNYSTGYIGQGFQSDGSVYISLFTNGTTYNYDGLTINYWVYPNAANQFSTITGMAFHSQFGANNCLITGQNDDRINYECGANQNVMDTNITEQKWYMVTMTCDATTCNTYFNATYVGSFANSKGAPFTLSNMRIGIKYDLASPINGMKIDEFMLLSKNSTQADIDNIYKAYIGNSEYMFSGEETNAWINVTWLAQNPADLTSTSMFSARANITYNITASTGTIDNSSVLIHYKVNSTTSDCLRIINGTSLCGYRNTTYDTATGSNYTFSIGDAKVYPYTENLDYQTYFRNAEHSADTLTSSNHYLAVEILNISTDKTYSYFEIDLNSTNNLTLQLWFCNSTYGFSSSPNSNPNCVTFGTITNTNVRNHTHNNSVVNASAHHVLPFAINSTAKTINGIGVSSTGYFLVRGVVSQTINVWKVDNISRTDAIRKTTNSGTSWTNQTFTIDSHLHQFDANDSVYYYACANTSTIETTCSSVKSDLLGLGNLSPTPPYVYSPNASQYLSNFSMDINYTDAVSPNGYNITGYDISIYDSAYTYVDHVWNNSLNLTYQWNNSAIPLGNYTIGVSACDTLNQCSVGYSEIFEIVRATTTTTTTTSTTTTAAGATTTTTYGSINPKRTSVNDILYIYSIMIPSMAFISMLMTFYLSHSRIKVNEKILTDEERFVKDTGREKTTYLLQPLLPLISSLLWFMSSYTTINIRFIDDFTTIMSPYYVDAGNWEIGMLFTAFGVIMGFYFLFSLLQSAVQSGFIRGDSR